MNFYYTDFYPLCRTGAKKVMKQKERSSSFSNSCNDSAVIEEDSFQRGRGRHWQRNLVGCLQQSGCLFHFSLFGYSTFVFTFTRADYLAQGFCQCKKGRKRHLYQLLGGKENSSIFSLLHLYYAVIFSLFTHSYGKHFRNYHKNPNTLCAKMKGKFATLL